MIGMSSPFHRQPLSFLWNLIYNSTVATENKIRLFLLFMILLRACEQPSGNRSDTNE